jgi:hypothetical protein
METRLTNGRSFNPNSVIQIPTAMKNAGTSGNKKLTTYNFVQPGLFRKINSDATAMTAERFRVRPI